jgi:hypothetical protein
MSTQSVTPDKSLLPMAGKYDGRGKHGNQHANSGSFVSDGKPGPKPKSRKNLAGAKSNRYLNKIEKLKSPVEMFKEAIEARNYALAWSIRTELRAEACGKPYVAVNPATERHDAADVSRIAVAINNLQIVNSPERPRLTKQGRANQVVTEGEMIPSGDTTSHVQVPLVATNGGECRILPQNDPDGIEAAEKAGTLP